VVARDHYPFGEEVTATGNNQKKFTGHYRDSETGMDYAGARYHHPTMGRWLGVDPMKGDISNPQRLNGYAYCLNDPINFIDPNGADPQQASQETPYRPATPVTYSVTVTGRLPRGTVAGMAGGIGGGLDYFLPIEDNPVPELEGGGFDGEAACRSITSFSGSANQTLTMSAGFNIFTDDVPESARGLVNNLISFFEGTEIGQAILNYLNSINQKIDLVFTNRLVFSGPDGIRAGETNLNTGDIAIHLQTILAMERIGRGERGLSFTRVLAHEFGHSLFRIDDGDPSFDEYAKCMEKYVDVTSINRNKGRGRAVF